MLCEAARHLDVRQPPAVLQLRGCQGLEGTLRIAHPMNRAAKPQLARGGDQELFQLCRALAIPPIADPDKIVFLPFFGEWLEESHVSRFVPGEDPATPAMLAIEVRKNLAEGQDRVVALEVQAVDLLGGRNTPVMGVMEQQGKATAHPAFASKRGHQLGIRPLMNQDNIGPCEERIEIGKRTVKAHGKFGKVRFEALHSAPPLLCEERSAAPAIGGFPGAAAMTAGDQFPQDAPLEVGIAMVPV